MRNPCLWTPVSLGCCRMERTSFAPARRWVRLSVHRSTLCSWSGSTGCTLRRTSAVWCWLKRNGRNHYCTTAINTIGWNIIIISSIGLYFQFIVMAGKHFFYDLSGYKKINKKYNALESWISKVEETPHPSLFGIVYRRHVLRWIILRVAYYYTIVAIEYFNILCSLDTEKVRLFII